MRFRAAVVGLGYWGPNLCRNFATSEDFALAAVCERDPQRLAKTGALYPGVKRFSDLEAMLREERDIDLVAVATPVATHFALAKAAIEAGCHVLVEKPLATSTEQVETLLEAGRRAGRRVFVDHTFVFTGAVAEIRKQLDGGNLGQLLYVDSTRVNLGLFQPDVDVIWDLVPHDLSILEAVLERAPRSVRAIGSCHNPRGWVDVAHLHLDYGDGLTSHLHLSWLSPVKLRRMIFAGTERSLIYDDLSIEARVKIYDHGIAFEVSDLESRRQVLVSYRKGEMRAPALSTIEALATEVAEIAKALRGEPSRAIDGQSGLRVVRTLEAATSSLARGAAAVPL